MTDLTEKQQALLDELLKDFKGCFMELDLGFFDESENRVEPTGVSPLS